MMQSMNTNTHIVATTPGTLSVPDAKVALAATDDPQEVAAFHRLAKAAAEYASTKPERFDAQEVELWAYRRLGELWRDTPYGDKLRDVRNLGFARDDSAWAQAIAGKSDAWLEGWIAGRRGPTSEPIYEQITEHAAWKAATVHVGQNEGENEWYTPPEYIAAAREVMGGIDLDPASTSEANTIVQAEQFYTQSDDGLAQEWHGRVWLNPPYAQPLIGKFSAKLVDEYKRENIEEACVLVNNATETDWFIQMGRVANAFCFPRTRVKFWAPGKVSAPLQGQAVLYFGANADKFLKVYQRFNGLVMPSE